MGISKAILSQDSMKSSIKYFNIIYRKTPLCLKVNKLDNMMVVPQNLSTLRKFSCPKKYNNSKISL